MELSQIGTKIEIVSLKHDEQLHRSWKENIILYRDDTVLIGANNKTIVEESNGKMWNTTEPAIFYFDKRSWFNIITIFQDNNYYYYCNLSSPFTYKNKSLQYIDYDIDVIVQSDLNYEIVDQAEYKVNKEKYCYPSAVDQSIEEGLHSLIEWIHLKKGPFKQSFPGKWLDVYEHNNFT